MKLAILSLLMFMSCSNFPPPLGTAVPIDIDPTLAVSTQDGGAGHACPVNGNVITALHVLRQSQELGGGYIEGGSWSDGYGNSGLLRPSSHHPALDIAIVEVTTPEVIHYLASSPVVYVGDYVYWFEFDFRTRANALRAHRRVAKVLRIVAQVIIFDGVPVPGASGSCLLDASGFVIGIVNGSWDTDDGKGAGVGVQLPVELR